MSAFEDMLKLCEHQGLRMAVIHVMDSAYLVKRWLDAERIDYTANDIAYFCKLILDEENSRRAKEE